MQVKDIVVVGAGLAGLRAAIGVNEKNRKAAILTKVHPVRSHSIAAQGGVNGALGNHHRGVTDSPKLHAFDTVKGSDYLADQDAALLMCEEAPKRIYELEHWGCPFSRDVNGRIAQRPFGGAGFPRTCYCADRTGHVMLHTLYEQAVRFEQGSERQELEFYEEWFVVSLIVDAGVCHGVIAQNMLTGELEAFAANAVIFGTGGAGRIYAETTNALINSAHGIAVPYWAGAAVKDMEFVQFHPTCLFGTNILMTEGCRGEGGFLVNNKKERFLANYSDSAKAMEIAPRDIVARNISRELLAGRGFGPGDKSWIALDLRHLGEKKIRERLPGIREISINFSGVDPILEPIPVHPAQHYTMGGIHVDKTGASPDIKGLYAAGECACVSVHGGNRLGGNSLLDTVVFGNLAGRAASDYATGATPPKNRAEIVKDALAKAKAELDALRKASGPEKSADIRKDLGTTMNDKVGIFRDKKQLGEALDAVLALKERMKKVGAKYNGEGMNPELLGNLELRANLDLAEVIVRGALAREESRGSHFRTDFETRDDAKFLHHTIGRYKDGLAEMSTSPVTLGIWEPKERKY